MFIALYDFFYECCIGRDPVFSLVQAGGFPYSPETAGGFRPGQAR